MHVCTAACRVRMCASMRTWMNACMHRRTSTISARQYPVTSRFSKSKSPLLCIVHGQPWCFRRRMASLGLLHSCPKAHPCSDCLETEFRKDGLNEGRTFPFNHSPTCQERLFPATFPRCTRSHTRGIASKGRCGCFELGPETLQNRRHPVKFNLQNLSLTASPEIKSKIC